MAPKRHQKEELTSHGSAFQPTSGRTVRGGRVRTAVLRRDHVVIANDAPILPLSWECRRCRQMNRLRSPRRSGRFLLRTCIQSSMNLLLTTSTLPSENARSSQSPASPRRGSSCCEPVRPNPSYECRSCRQRHATKFVSARPPKPTRSPRRIRPVPDETRMLPSTVKRMFLR
jgi:hypothetical protein